LARNCPKLTIIEYFAHEEEINLLAKRMNASESFRKFKLKFESDERQQLDRLDYDSMECSSDDDADNILENEIE
jgi:hypothetical protein